MTYTKDQVARIEEVNQAAKTFINLLITCPEYLSKHLPAQLIVPPMQNTLPVMVADTVADFLSSKGYTVFYPNHVETANPPAEYITDVYETQEQMENHIIRLTEQSFQ